MELESSFGARSERAGSRGESASVDAGPLAPTERDKPSAAWKVTARDWPIVVVAVLLFALHAWLVVHGRPECGSDGIFFKQPSLMALGGKGFILPTAEGFLPGSSIVYGAQPPLESYLTAAAFWAFGPGMEVSVGLDVVVHLCFLGVLLLVSRRLGAGPWTGSLLLLSGSFFLWPVGRPDELAALLALLAILAEWSSRRWWLTGLLLGLAALARPVGGVLGGMGVALIAVSRDRPARSASRVAAIAAEAIVVLVLLWLPVIAADPSLAIRQFLLHSTEMRYMWYGPQLLMSFASPPVLILLAAMGTAGVLWGRARTRMPAELRAAVGLFVCWGLMATTLLAVAGSPPYHWKLPFGAGLAVSCAEVSWLIRRRRTMRWGIPVAVLLTSLVLWTGARPTVDLVARGIEPAFGGAHYVSQDDLKRAVESRIPATATVGGSGSLWWILGPGRGFLERFFFRGQPPDYMLSTKERTGTLTHLERDGTWGPLLAEQYEPVEAPELAGDCEVTVLGRRLWGGCDWGVRMWRRRADASP